MKSIVCSLIRFYRKYLSLDSGYLGSLFPSGAVCRFTPHCSEYTLIAVERYGIMTGLYLGFKRIIRCHPGNKGGYDPVPNL